MSNDTSKVLSISDRMINKCEVILRGLNVDFYIRRESGEEIMVGDIQVKVKKKKTSTRKKRAQPFGTFSSMFREAGVDKMVDGSVLRIDCQGHEPVRVQGSLSAYATYHWGKGASTTATGKDYVEIFRHPPLGE